MRALALLAALALAGCGDRRGELTVWSEGHPRIVLCESQAEMAAHAPGFEFVRFSVDGIDLGVLHELYVRDEDTVYLLCADGDGRISIRQALYLAHGLQHRADQRNKGSMWDVLQDLSSPNGYAMGGDDFDCHAHVRISPQGGLP